MNNPGTHQYCTLGVTKNYIFKATPVNGKIIAMKETILIVDDEKNIVEMLSYNLTREGFKTCASCDGEHALKLAQNEKPALILLDLMLPGIDGLEVCKILKQSPETRAIPIIMITAKSQETDKIIGLELGADDYIAKPFSPREVIARVKAVLRRTQPAQHSPKDTLTYTDIAINTSTIEVMVKEKIVHLTAKEFELLKTLAQAKGRVLSRDFLLDAIWGFDNAGEIQTRTVDVHIRTLRKKLKTAARRIVTVKNYGYRFESE